MCVGLGVDSRLCGLHRETTNTDMSARVSQKNKTDRMVFYFSFWFFETGSQEWILYNGFIGLLDTIGTGQSNNDCLNIREDENPEAAQSAKLDASVVFF